MVRAETIIIIVVISFLCTINADDYFLRVDRDRKTFTYNGTEVFLNGVNQAWIQYGNDFGNNQTNAEYCALKDSLQQLRASGGHALRIWLFVEGSNIPKFDGNGNVVGTDGANSLISDMRRYLRTAQQEGILIIWCLWNGAVLRPENTQNLIRDSGKLQTFIDHALTPMVKALADEPAVGAWEIINEPEGSILMGKDDPNPCFSTKNNDGDWTGDKLLMKDMLSFINRQADAIHRADPKALVTVGTWEEAFLTNKFGYFNHYTDECLRAAGGRSLGTLDFYEVHNYAYKGKFSDTAPFKHSASDYDLDRPLVVGEFNAVDGDGAGMNPEQMYNYVYDHGYNGAWGWTIEPQYNNLAGVASLRGKPRTYLTMPMPQPFPDTCNCSDNPPSGGYTCQQQASWGKCDQPWMKAYCCKSCHHCEGCK